MSTAPHFSRSQSTRGRRLRLALTAGILGSSAGFLAIGPVSQTAASASSSPGVTFVATIPSELAGGAWELSTSTLYPSQSIVLASGTLAADATTLSAFVSSAAALVQGGSNEFSLYVARTIDPAHAWTGGYITGLTPQAVLTGTKVTATLHIDKVDTGSPTQALATSPSGQAASTSSTTATNNARPPSQSTIFQAPSRSSVPQPRTGPTYVDPSTSSTLPSPQCVGSNTCGNATPVAVNAANPNCSGGLSNTDCIVDSQDIHGVQTFRGYEAHVAGEDQTFDVQQSNTDSMDNGYRASAGPFSVSGHTSISNGTGSDTTWPVQGYCWSGLPDPNGCAADGSLSTFGNDSWRWEKHLFTGCSIGGCTTTIFEDLYDMTYDGGTQLGYTDSSGYYALPSQIKSGSKGNWASYLPGAKVSIWLQRTWAYGNAADVSVNFADASSSTSFSSSEEYQTYTRVTNSHSFMTYNFLGDFYRYDNGQSPWQAEFWSCDWATGWTGGGPCYTNGA